MIYTPLTVKAMNLAYTAHHGQLDQGGAPYIFHPYHLAEQMPDEVTTCAALLHDVVEDTPVTLEELAAEFPKEVVDAVRVLTRGPAVDYLDYIRAIRTNPATRTVKFADLEHNSDLSRLTKGTDVPEERRIRRQEKYRWARAILENWEAI